MKRLVSLLFVSLAASLALGGCSRGSGTTKEELARHGDFLVAQNKLAEAIIEYRRAEQIDPRFAEVRLKLADAYLASGDVPHAYGEYVRAADLLPADERVQVKAGEILLAAGKFNDAMGRADNALARFPKSTDLIILKANALAGVRRIDDAIDEINQAIKDDPDRSDIYSRLGAFNAQGGHRPEAEVAFKTAIRLDPTSVRAKLALANFYWRTGRYDLAEPAFKAALTLDPHDATANQALAYFYVDQRQSDQAEPYFLTVAQTAKNSVGKLVLADYYLAMQKPNAARAVLEDVAAHEGSLPQQSAAKIRLAGMGYASGARTADVIAMLDDVIAKDSHNVSGLLAKANVLASAGKLNEAVEPAVAAVGLAPYSATAQFSLGKLRELRKEDDLAARAFRAALKINPRLGAASVEVAKLELADGQIDAALQSASDAVAASPRSVDAEILLARINLMKGNVQAAEPTVRILAHSLPDDSAVEAQIGQLNLLQGNRTAARAAFDKALAADPSSLDALAGLVAIDLQEQHLAALRSRLEAAVARSPQNGAVLLFVAKAYQAIGDRAAAQALVQRSIQTNDANFEAYRVLSTMYVVNGQLDAAIAELSALAQKQTKPAGIETAIGMLFEMKKQPVDARTHYERALSLDPGASIAANNLAMITLTQGGSLDVALNLAQSAVARHPEEAAFSDTLGWIYFRKGLVSFAVPLLEKASVKRPDNAVYLAHLGLAYSQNGEGDKARATLQRALTHGDAFPEAQEVKRALAVWGG